MRNLIAVCILLILSVNSQAEPDFDMALAAYEKEDYQTAHALLSQLAVNNHTEAQYHLAFMYFGGDGVEQNDNKAFYWFDRAARAGHAPAQDILAYMYLHGRGVKKDRAHAYAWYRIAADNGIFLAEKISENLRREMGTDEFALARRLSREFSKKYPNQ